MCHDRPILYCPSSNVIGIFCAEGDEIWDADETFLSMTGYSRDDLRLGRLNWYRMTAHEYLDITRRAQQRLALHEYIPPYKKEYLRKDGSRVPVIVGGVLTHRDSFQTICFVLDASVLPDANRIEVDMEVSTEGIIIEDRFICRLRDCQVLWRDDHCGARNRWRILFPGDTSTQ